MKVIANAKGFYAGIRRRPNEEFDVADGDKASWFDPVDAADEPKATAKAKSKAAAKPAAKATAAEPAKDEAAATESVKDEAADLV